MNKTGKTMTAAQNILTAAEKFGWSVAVRGDVLTIAKTITPGDLASFSQADSEYWYVLSAAPRTRSGSIWGTDGGGVGAVEALRTGVFRMNKSGVSKPVLRAVERLLAA